MTHLRPPNRSLDSTPRRAILRACALRSACHATIYQVRNVVDLVGMETLELEVPAAVGAVFRLANRPPSLQRFPVVDVGGLSELRRFCTSTSASVTWSCHGPEGGAVFTLTFLAAPPGGRAGDTPGGRVEFREWSAARAR